MIAAGFVTFGIHAQNVQKIDSLELSLTYSKTDSVETLLMLTKELKKNNPDKALEYAQLALTISKRESYLQKEINSMILLAEIYWGMTEFKPAMEIATEANILSKENGMVREQALALRLIGRIYVDLGNYDKASEYFFSSLKLFEEIQDKAGIAKALSSIGYVYFDQQNYDKALEYYFKSLNIAKEIKDQDGIARGLNNLAATYGSRKEFNKVRKYIEEAIVINQKLGNKLWVGINYMNLGLTSEELGNPEKAKKYFDKALSIFLELNNAMWQSKCYLNMATYDLNRKDFDIALRNTQTALELGQQFQMKRVVFESYNLLRNINLAKGDTISAYNYSVMESAIKDSLDVEKNKILISKLELQYEFEKKEQEALIQQQKIDFYTIISFIILSFILIIIFLLWARQRVKAKNSLLEKKALEEKLEFKNKEFTLHVMSLMKKNEIISNIIDKLIKIEKEAVKDDTKNSIRRIAADLQKSTDSEIWDEFELRFSQVHGDFYEKLLKQFPNLTPSEQKLCAFLRLNLTTKEISELTGQSISTLEIARYRLRKKLNISNSKINLVTFLSKIK